MQIKLYELENNIKEINAMKEKHKSEVNELNIKLREIMKDNDILVKEIENYHMQKKILESDFKNKLVALQKNNEYKVNSLKASIINNILLDI